MRVGPFVAGVIAAAVLAWPVVPVHAQRDGAPAYEPKPAEIEKKRNAARLDQQYRDALERSTKPAEAVNTDPWQNMRGAGDAKAKK
jgi:hypothetical protein